MADVTIKADFSMVKAMLTKAGRKAIPLATAKTLTFLAKNVEKKTYEEMQDKFDRPTPMVMKSLRVKTATANDLHARVFVKGWPMAKTPNSMADVIGHQFSGGGRVLKRVEKRFRQAGLLDADEYLVPGEKARIDRYGNISRGQVQQILSQIGLSISGADNVKTDSPRSKKSVSRAGRMFWADGTRGLAKGVWIGKKASVLPILMAVREPSYKALINMDAIEKEERDTNAVKIFDRVLKKEMEKYK